jgi:hypothetical protein
LPTVRAIGSPNTAPGVQIRRSQAAASASPLPIANPSTNAIAGTRTRSSRPTTRSIVRSYSSPSSPEENSRNRRMSVPATNARSPAPRSTSTRTASSDSAREQ